MSMVDNVTRQRYGSVGGAVLQTGKVMCDTDNKQDFQSTDNMAELNGMVRVDSPEIAKELAYDIIHHMTGFKSKKLKPMNSKYSRTMRRTVDELSEKHKIYFDGAVKRLEISEENVHATIDNVANEMFADQQFNWGRLVTLYAFCGKLAQNGAPKCANQRDFVEKVADYTADYVCETLYNRIRQFGGWDAFVDYFPEPENMENTIWKGLIYTVVGLGALATMVAAR